MAVYAIDIAGNTPKMTVSGFTLSEAVNAVDSLTVEVLSDGSYRPAIDDAVEFTEDATVLFGGLVESVTERGRSSSSHTGKLHLTLRCKGYSIYAQRRLVTVSLAAGTLKSQLTTLVAELSTFSTTLHASQVNGPTMAAASYTKRRLDEILDELATASGYVWKIDENNVLRMVDKGDISAPFNVVNTDGNAIGDITVTSSRNDLYANRVYVECMSGPATSTEVFTAADGVTSGGFVYFTTAYPASSSQNEAWPNEFIFNGVPSGPVGFVGISVTNAWDWDSANHRLRYTSASGATFPSGGDTITVTYAIQYPITVMSEDAAAQATYGLWERTVTPEDALTLAAAQDLADGLVSAQSPVKQEVFYATKQTGIRPGMTQTITVTKRNINTTVLVQEVTTTCLDSTEAIREVSAVTAAVAQGTFRGTLNQWMKGGKAAGGVTGSSAQTPTQVDKAVISQQYGSLYGDDHFVYDYDRSGPFTYGSGSASHVAIKQLDENGYNLALVSSDDESVAFIMYDGGDMYVEQSAGGMVWIAAGDWEVSPFGHITYTCQTQYTDQIRLRGLTSIYGLATGVARTTSTTYTMDSAGAPITTLICDASGGAITVNLPALANGAISTASGYRILAIRNDGASNNVTIDPNSSETINGASTLVLTPGQSVLIQAWNGTGAEWKILASHGL